jgi:hypothetical protein
MDSSGRRHAEREHAVVACEDRASVALVHIETTTAARAMLVALKRGWLPHVVEDTEASLVGERVMRSPARFIAMPWTTA